MACLRKAGFASLEDWIHADLDEVSRERLSQKLLEVFSLNVAVECAAGGSSPNRCRLVEKQGPLSWTSLLAQIAADYPDTVRAIANDEPHLRALEAVLSSQAAQAFLSPASDASSALRAASPCELRDPAAQTWLDMYGDPAVMHAIFQGHGSEKGPPPSDYVDFKRLEYIAHVLLFWRNCGATKSGVEFPLGAVLNCTVASTKCFDAEVPWHGDVEASAPTAGFGIFWK